MFQFIVTAALLANVSSPMAQLSSVAQAPLSVYSVHLNHSNKSPKHAKHTTHQVSLTTTTTLLHKTISHSLTSSHSTTSGQTLTSSHQSSTAPAPAAQTSQTQTAQTTSSTTQNSPAAAATTQTATSSTSPATTAANVATLVAGSTQVVASVPISFTNNAVFFNAEVGTTPVQFQLDTGAYETVISQSYASQLNLPNLGNVTIFGVGGQAQAYNSDVTLNIGGVQFANVPCIVDSSYTGAPLFGYNFFDQNNYDLLVSHRTSTMSILNSPN